MADVWDLVVIGGGPGGYATAIRAAQLGARVLMVEKRDIGGTCLNRGCIPTKTMVHAAELYTSIKEAAAFGIQTERVDLDFAQVMRKKREVSLSLRTGLATVLKGVGVTVVTGQAQIRSKGEIVVGEEVFGYRYLVIATGSIDVTPPIAGRDLPGLLNSETILELEALPKELIIVGGGVIGMEFASLFAAFGSKVAVIEMLPMVLPPVDEELARRLTMSMRKRGVQLITAAKVQEISCNAEGYQVRYLVNDEEKVTFGDQVLMATGRAPHLGGLDVSSLGLTFDRKIAVDDFLQTGVENVYAVGDVTGQILLAHTAFAQGIRLAENLFSQDGIMRPYQPKAVPWAVFTYPELAGVGLTEKEARSQGYEIEISRFSYNAIGKAQAMGETEGMFKLIRDQHSDKLLGVHLMGKNASDLVHEGALAVEKGLTVADIRHTIHAHPTLAEGMFEAAENFVGASIHFLKR